LEFITKIVKAFRKYKDFFLISVKAELTLEVSRSYLGYVWWILDPLLYMGIYIFVVSFIFQRGGPNYPVFVFSGLLIWRWTSSSLTESTNSIVRKKNLLDQVYLPKFILPMVQIVKNTLFYLFSLTILLLLIVIYKIPFTLHFFEIIPIVIIQTLFLFGLGLWFSHLGVYFYDFDKYIRFILRLWYYLSPGLYEIESVPEKLRPIMWLNPLTITMQGSRDLFMYNRSPNYLALSVLGVVSIVIIYSGLFKLDQFDRSYTKVI
jgi:ABC-type polysaccharide/polyol phosphate export permease